VQSGLYVALSSQIALERRLTTIADNVANANTVGFRSTGIRFDDVVTGLGADSVSFTSPGKTYLPDRSGPLRETGNPFDFAIEGDAWFAVETPSGIVMTRDGRFTMLENGDLVTLEGYAVLDPGAAPLQLDPAGGAPTAGKDGILRQDGQLMGAVGLFAFEPGEDFVRYGGSGIVPRAEPIAILDRPDIGVAQGFVEDSNVNPIQEMTRLIMVQRAFENAAALVRDSETSLDEAIRTLGSTS
jgi:flagellar basal-body rod protein FlgF